MTQRDIDKVAAALTAHGQTSAQISIKTGLATQTVSDCLHELHRREVAAFGRGGPDDGFFNLPVWSAVRRPT